ncbi:MAG: hypothetical protein H8M99_11215 [Gloeobacteraceae cyanobacterium ES-bin-144]|nr:hypothetical protein [Verrucomicrobiales bacterium]
MMLLRTMTQDSRLVFTLLPFQALDMESHEWFENTDEGKVYYRANYMSGKWTIMTTMQKRDPTWTDVKPVSEPIWRELRDIVWKKYQRKRCPWERVADLDKLLGDEPPAR